MTSFISNLPYLCQKAIEAAHLAGSIINDAREQKVRSEKKAVGDSEASQVVTEVDRKAQQAIIDTLTPTLLQYDLAILAEESPDDGSRFDKPAFWCIDPMDGTLAFVKKKTGFSVAIALVSKNGDPLIGVVYDPINNDTYHAIKKSGAFKNNEPINPPQLIVGSPLVLVADFSFQTHPKLEETREGLQGIAKSLGLTGSRIEYRIGAVMNALASLTEANYCYFKYARNENSGGSIWDYAATACLFSELKLVASDIFGKPMELNRPTSSFMNHRGIIYSPSRELADKIIKLNHRLES